MVEQEKYPLSFSFNEFLMLSFFLLVTGNLACLWQLASKVSLTPEAMFEQVWTVTVTFLLTIGLLFIIGNVYYKFKHREDSDEE